MCERRYTDEAIAELQEIAMKPKPRPKELLVQLHIPHSHIVEIYAHSDDARQWIVENAPGFGNLYPPDVVRDRYLLFVPPTFDVDEVIAYIDSYNDE